MRPPTEGSLALTAAAASSLANPALISLAPPPLANDAIRVNHTGLEANLPAVLSAVEALAGGMRALGHDADRAAALAMAGETGASEAADMNRRLTPPSRAHIHGIRAKSSTDEAVASKSARVGARKKGVW